MGAMAKSIGVVWDVMVNVMMSVMLSIELPGVIGTRLVSALAYPRHHDREQAHASW